MKRSALVGAAALALVASTPFVLTVTTPAMAQERSEQGRDREWRDRDRGWRDGEARRGNDERNENDRERAAVRDARLTLEDAIGVARREIPGGRVVDADVDDENGRVSYAIDIEDRNDIMTVLVDPRTGDVIRVFSEREDDDEDD
jgi:uncharacterized membrane protein YkoI